MARRSSARLRDKASTTPKRVSLSHDAPSTRTPRTVPSKLASLQESDEMPGAFPDSPSVLETKQCVATPTKHTPIKPSEEEMHPQLYHQTTAKPREEARHLGFSNMAPHTEPPQKKSKIATLQATPSKTRNLEADVKSPNFQFTFRREHSLELSPEAKKLMQEQREKAAKIREQMMAEGQSLPSIDEMVSRKIAKPKGRFSQVHLKEFQKMDSIAGHASAHRLKVPSSSSSTEKVPLKGEGPTAKSLKRSPSKAELDQPSSTPPRPSSRDKSKPLPAIPGSQLPRSHATHDLTKAGPSSPAKRFKRVDTDDVSATRPSSSDGEKSQPGTPRKYPDLSHLTTPTQSSLARASSVKSVKTGSKIPAPSFTPAKNAPTCVLKHHAKVEEYKQPSEMLAKSPLKASLFGKNIGGKGDVTDGPRASPLLLRSPLKSAVSKPSADTDEHGATHSGQNEPLLLRSPVKATASKEASSGELPEKKAPAIPFFARSPTKLPVASGTTEASETPGKSTSSKLLGRFNLLRQSPMKSILRSPQRLYSDDPAKVAAGTHLATPPKITTSTNKALPAIPGGDARTPAQKHVDFSSSTKARELKANSSTPSHTPTPSPNPSRNVTMSVEPEPVGYPDLSEEPAMLSPSPQKRRQTSGPSDFTFRAGSQDIVFSQSPPKGPSSTIRMVSYAPSPAPATGSKKRKFEFENHAAAAEKDSHVTSDKENTPAADEEEKDEGRHPAKRVKPNASEPSPAKKGAFSSATAPTAQSAARRTTLGVKPKGAKSASPVKRVSTISQSRLAALAQPKKRG